MTVLCLAVAACAGAICRYLVDVAVQHRISSVLPLGTFAVNATASFGAGLVAGLGLYHGLGDPALAVAGPGFMGAYSTFSTYSYEVVRLLEDGAHREALISAVVSVGIGLIAAALGLALAAAL